MNSVEWRRRAGSCRSPSGGERPEGARAMRAWATPAGYCSRQPRGPLQLRLTRPDSPPLAPSPEEPEPAPPLPPAMAPRPPGYWPPLEQQRSQSGSEQQWAGRQARETPLREEDHELPGAGGGTRDA